TSPRSSDAPRVPPALRAERLASRGEARAEYRRSGSLRGPRLSRVAELGELGQTREREDALVLLAVDHPGRIGVHTRLHAALIEGLVIPEWIALHVRQAVGGRPEPGLLLFARGSPVGAIEYRLVLLEVLREGDPVAFGRSEIGGEDEGGDGGGRHAPGGRGPGQRLQGRARAG